MLNELALRVLSVVQGLAARTKDEEGQTLAEYGLIVAVIAVAVVALALFTFKDEIIGAFDNGTACLDNGVNGTC
ncbi:MAG: Flp family type IVb pilin [Dehalococcoidia bacterium]